MRARATGEHDVMYLAASGAYFHSGARAAMAGLAVRPAREGGACATAGSGAAREAAPRAEASYGMNVPSGPAGAGILKLPGTFLPGTPFTDSVE